MTKLQIGKLITLCLVLGGFMAFGSISYFGTMGSEEQAQSDKPDNERIANEDTVGERLHLDVEGNAGVIIGTNSVLETNLGAQPALSGAANSVLATEDTAPPISATDQLYQDAELERLKQTLEMDNADVVAARIARREATAAKIQPTRFTHDDFAQATKTGALYSSPSTDQSASAQGTISPSQVLAGDAASTPIYPDNSVLRAKPQGQTENAIGYSKYRKEPARSPYEIKKGTVIPGTLITEINSDIPGNAVAMVRLDVYDTVTGNHLLIPSGSRVFGVYDPDINYAQRRLNVIWTHLIFPNGDTVVLEDQQATDLAGRAGFKDQRKGNFLKLFAGNLLFSILDTGETALQNKITEEISGPASTNDGSIADAIAGLGNNLGGSSNPTAASRFNQQQGQLQPTLKIRTGYRFNIIVSKDIILEPL